MKINFKKQYLFNLFLFFYLILGFYFSINTGISADEFFEQKNWKTNLDAIKNIFGEDNDGYSSLLEYQYRFYGIGFHYFSQIYLSLLNLILKLDQFPNEISPTRTPHGLSRQRSVYRPQSNTPVADHLRTSELFFPVRLINRNNNKI